MSADGTTFVVGAPYNNGINGNESGHVRVYKFNSSHNTYDQVGLDIDGEAAGDYFGYSVSMSADGTTFVVGATSNNGINGTDSGHVRVYKFNLTTDTYIQVGFDIDGEAGYDWFGYSVSISADGTTFVVGARNNDGIGTDSGHVRVYKFDSTVKRYIQVGADIDGEATDSLFGYSVSMSADGSTFAVCAYGDKVIGSSNDDFASYDDDIDDDIFNNIGSYIDDIFGSNDDRDRIPNAGRVSVYKFNPTINRYSQIWLDIGEDYDYSGKSVSMSGDGTTFVAGSVMGRYGAYSILARVFKFDSTNNMYAKVGLDIVGDREYEAFRTSVSMSADGTTFVVGSPDSSYWGFEFTHLGRVRVYKFDPTINRYAQVGMEIDGEEVGGYFGDSVSMSGDGTTFVVGATGYNGVTGTNSGHVRVYSTSLMGPTPTRQPTKSPTTNPTREPTKPPTTNPTRQPTESPTKNPTEQPTKSPTRTPTTQPIIAPTISCTVTWKLFNSQTDSFVANLSNGTFVTTPPPCGRTNIEAVVPCGDLDNAVNLELFRDTGSQRIRRRVERAAPYFLFGNSGSNVFDGRIEPGTYRIRANVNGIFTPFTTFTLQGPKCY